MKRGYGSISLTTILVLLAPAVALAAWSSEPVTVQATSDDCPLVAAGSDGSEGAIVVWQQRDPANPTFSRLLARRLLASGDLDPGWPSDGLLVSSQTTAQHDALGVVGDDIGGAYVWWMESDALYVTRVLAGGAIAPGWPARGRMLGALRSTAYRPQVTGDGQGGLWLSWFSGDLLTSAGNVMHVGPANAGAGGWGDEPAQYAMSRPYPTGLQTLAFAFSPAADGGGWIAWGETHVTTSGWQPGTWRLSRLTAIGDFAPGWTNAGVSVGDFHAEFLGEDPYRAASPVAVSHDGTGGAYVQIGHIADGGGTPMIMPVLLRLDAGGAPNPVWPAGGITLGYAPSWSDGGGDAAARLLPEAGGGVFAVHPVSYTHQAGAAVQVERVTPTGAQLPWSGGSGRSLELAGRANGEMLVATYWPTGPLGPYAPNAYIGLDQTLASGAKAPGFFEWHDAPGASWYGDVGVAPASGAGAILVWSQHRERFGVFARRFSATGEITGVPSAGDAGRLRLRFAAGRGVTAGLGAGTGGRIELLDVMGRVLAAVRVPDGAHEVTLRGTERLPAGLYFARHRAASGAIEAGKVAVVR